MKKSIKVMLCAVAAMSAVLPVWGQDQAFTAEQQEAVQRIVASKLPEHMGVGDLKVRSLNIENDTIKVDVSENFGDVPFTEEGVERMRSEIRSALGSEYSDSPVLITIVGNDINKRLSASWTPTATTSTAWTATSSPCGPATAGILSPNSTAGSGSEPA